MGKREPLPLPTIVASPHVDTRFERGRDALVRADEPTKKAEKKVIDGRQDEQEEDDQTAKEQLPDDEDAVGKKPELPARRRRRAPCDCVLRPASATRGCRLT